jgi:hypothetical protein
MPIEVTQLQDKPVPIESCPECGATPFIPFLRGSVQRGTQPWWLAWRFWVTAPTRPYCALICSTCKEIVGYE